MQQHIPETAAHSDIVRTAANVETRETSNKIAAAKAVDRKFDREYATKTVFSSPDTSGNIYNRPDICR